jgi:hypothetical protein
MNGDYIRVMSDGSECFVKDTEVFLSLYTEKPDVYVRPTIQQFNYLIENGMGDFLGKHIVGQYGDNKDYFVEEHKIRSIEKGTEIWDLEWCEIGEFYFLYDNQSLTLNRVGTKIENL